MKGRSWTRAALALTTTIVAGLAMSAPSVAAGSLPVLTLALNGKQVTVGGQMVSGAVTVQTTVTGEAQGNPALIYLDPGVTLADVAAIKAKIQAHHGDFNYLDGYGRLVYSDTVNKGQTGSAQVPLVAGTYLALDLNSKHNGPTPFQVSAASAPAALPAPAATVASIEFGFTGPKTWHDGQLIRFENDGFLVHMIVGAELKNPAQGAKVLALLKAGKDNAVGKYLGNAQPTFNGGLSSGAMQQKVINEPPGTYVVLCFMDTQDGREHTTLGMEELVKIVK